MGLGHTKKRVKQGTTQRNALHPSAACLPRKRVTGLNIRRLLFLLPLPLLSSCGSQIGSSDLTRTPTKYGVQLKWDAPGGSDAAVSYNVYRELTGGSSSFAQINTSPVVAVSYTDKNVQLGASYTYAVSAVDAGGGESGPSNTITVTIPSN
jgi:hypothetical protein